MGKKLASQALQIQYKIFSQDHLICDDSADPQPFQARPAGFGVFAVIFLEPATGSLDKSLQIQRFMIECGVGAPHLAFLKGFPS